MIRHEFYGFGVMRVAFHLLVGFFWGDGGHGCLGFLEGGDSEALVF